MAEEKKEGNIYDEVPYPVASYPQTHPDRLYVIGRLFGMQPKPVEECRVLELGCASGGNIIPMAYSLPRSEFVGLDYSARQIESGEKLIESAGLSNLTLKCKNLDDFREENGKFDYLIAHGVYSWVGKEDRDAIFRICRESLSPAGIAYISYNAYPGWKMRGMLREMLLFHTSPIEDLKEKVKQARAFTQLLVESNPLPEDPYGIYLKKELKHMKAQTGSGVLHDLLEEYSDPVYFHQFVSHAGENGLQYLGEAEFHSMLRTNFPVEVNEVLERLRNDLIATEQYMDFLRNRTLRQTLLCRQEVELNRTVRSSIAKEFYLASNLKPLSGKADLRKGVNERFQSQDGAEIETQHPLAKAFLCVLGEKSPQTISFVEGLEEAQERLGNPGLEDDVTEELSRLLMGAYSKNIIKFRSLQPVFHTKPSEYPKASSLARAQAANGTEVTNQLHQTIRMDFLSRKIISLLDGKNSIEEIGEKLIEKIESGEIDLQQGEKKVEDRAEIRAVLKGSLPGSIEKFAQRALLVG